MKAGNERPIRILLVDDKLIIREGLIAMLDCQDDMQIIAEAANGSDAIEQFRYFQPTLTLMDMSMPVMDGITATRAIVREFPAALILMFSADPDIEAESLKAGATAFLPKDASQPDLVDAIHAICHALPTARRNVF